MNIEMLTLTDRNDTGIYRFEISCFLRRKYYWINESTEYNFYH
jgi:hypothetical protein